ncbi:uncharacterized protein MELLADRAFT_105175 [Melampsora larici-populina 98AG31]|uniref:Uncharacterized protein n=1 Tax=Melampsora larici-populina (strain 98AG31 / pathotype 3-4-7) TaxID=747676 RepID=F4RGV5_MELLP|nr:uncharacterized protein MELLADRAFT_105175 [Melampsora larici-populina 98AG31]EGG08329.1 hypothetical protein MELLADRAFT_105175 [Melampsora larici-populina 98AG31]
MNIRIYYHLACLSLCSATIFHGHSSDTNDFTRPLLSQAINEDWLGLSLGNEITEARQEGISKCSSSPDSSIHLSRTYGFLNDEERAVTQKCAILKRIRYNASQWWKNNLNLFSRMYTSDHHSIYFDLVESVIRQSNNQFMVSLAKNMRNFQFDLLSNTMFRSSTNINENIMIYSIYLALAALEDSALLAKERYWVLGILECIKCNARKISKDSIYNLHNKDRISRGELELYLIEGKIKAEKVKELWEYPEAEDIDDDMREVLKRVELLNKMFVESETTSEAPIVAEFKNVYDQLLVSKLPLKRQQIASMVKNIKRLIVESDVPPKQKALIHELCWHLHTHSKTFGKNLEHMILIDEEFQDCFHKIRAKESLNWIIRSYDSNTRMRKILLPFAKSDTITADQLQLILIQSRNYLFNDSERCKIFEAVVAASTLNNGLFENISTKLSKHAQLPWEVVELASRFDVDPDFPGAATLDFEYLIFLKHPGLLDAAQRARYVEVLYESKNRRLTMAERLMSSLSWIKNSKNETSSCKAFDAMMLQISNQYESDRKSHVLNLESLRHIFKTAQRRIGNKLIKRIQTDKILADHLKEVSNDILLGIVKTSGVSEGRVKNFAEWLMSIIGYHYPSPEYHMRPMKSIERWYSIGKY